MIHDIELELEASDVFELNVWLDEMRQQQWNSSIAAQFNRTAGSRHTFEARLALLEKISNGIKNETPHL